MASCACRAFGPSAAAAQLEGSKAFLKVSAAAFPRHWNFTTRDLSLSLVSVIKEGSLALWDNIA